MKLLEVEKVKEETKQSTQDRIKRVAKLNEEETIIVKRINELREQEKKAKQRFFEESEEGQPVLLVRKTVLSQEVDLLENRKKEALKPVDEILTKTKVVYQENQETTKFLVERKNRLKDQEEQLLERVEKVVERENEVELLEIKLGAREKGIVAGENELKRSSKELAEKWVDYHNGVHSLNTKIEGVERREKEMEDGRRTNENFKINLDKKEKEQSEHDKQIADRYLTLGRAIGEAKKKYKINL